MKEELYNVVKGAVTDAIEEVGLEGLKKTSMFLTTRIKLVHCKYCQGTGELSFGFDCYFCDGSGIKSYNFFV